MGETTAIRTTFLYTLNTVTAQCSSTTPPYRTLYTPYAIFGLFGAVRTPLETAHTYHTQQQQKVFFLEKS